MRQRRCKNIECRRWYKPLLEDQKVCSPECAYVYTHQLKLKLFKSETKRRRDDFNSRDKPWLHKQASKECNAYIRLRDQGKPCISCGHHQGRKMNAGHFKSVGAHPAIRYHELNINLQCERCNSYQSGNSSEYRVRLEKRIGGRSVEYLEQYHPPQHRTLEDLQDIRMWYRMKLQILERRKLSQPVNDWLKG